MSEIASDYQTLRYEEPSPGVARIVLARVDARNAQDKRMTYELNTAFDRAAQDDAVKVIVLAADGPHFSSGHDLRDRASMSDFEPVSNWVASRGRAPKATWPSRRRSTSACAGAGATSPSPPSRRCRARRSQAA